MEKIAENITNLIHRNNDTLTQLEIKKIQFGLHCMLGETSKFLIYLSLFTAFSLTNYFLTAFFFFCILRLVAGGYHAESYWGCFFTCLFIFTVTVLIGGSVYFSVPIKIIISVICIIITYIYAPVDHPNKPIISKLRRKRFKHLSLSLIIVLSFISFLLPAHYSSVATLAIFVEVLTLPVGEIAKGRYRNEPIER